MVWAVGAGIGVLTTAWLYLPPVHAIQRSAQECAKLKVELAKERRTVQALRQGTVSVLPPVEQLPEILAQLNAVARSHQVEVLEVTPQPARPGSASDPVTAPLDLRVEGEYRSLGEFLGALRQTPFIGVAVVRRIVIHREEQGLPRLRAWVSIELSLGSAVHG